MIQFSTVLCNLGTLAIGSMDITTAGFSILSFSAKTVGSQDGLTDYPISICGNGQEMIPVTVNIALPSSGYFQGYLYLNFQLTSTPYSFSIHYDYKKHRKFGFYYSNNFNEPFRFVHYSRWMQQRYNYVRNTETLTGYTSTYSATSIVVTGTVWKCNGNHIHIFGGTMIARSMVRLRSLTRHNLHRFRHHFR